MNVIGQQGMDLARAESAYWSWVDRLGEHFFNERMMGKPVRLYWPTDGGFDKDAFLHDIRAYNGDRDPVKVGRNLRHAWDMKTGSLSKTTYRMWDGPLWTRQPPYLPYLVAFALAWDVGGDYSSSNYYSRLNNEIFGLRAGSISTNEFKYSETLWRGLEQWSEREHSGQQGIFKANQVGQHRWVGYPLSQVVLRAADRVVLHGLFGQLGLGSDDYLEDEEIKSIFFTWRNSFSGVLERRIANNNNLFMDALCEEFRVELSHFEYMPSAGRSYGGKAARSSSSIGLVCSIGTAGISGLGFTDLSDEPLLSTARSPGYVYDQSSSRTVLWRETDEGLESNPLKFEGFAPLGKKIVLTSGDGLKIRWASHEVRFLAHVPGSLSEFVESNYVPESTPCLVLADDSESVQLTGAGLSPPLKGACWEGCSIHQCDDLGVLRKRYPNRVSMRMPEPLSITGGLRIRRHEDIYFPFALPRVEALDGWSVDVSGARLLDDEGKLVDPVGIDQGIIVTARCTKDVGTGRERSRELAVEDRPAHDAMHPIPYVPSEHVSWGEVAYEARDQEPTQLGSKSCIGSRILQVLSTWGECSYRKYVGACKEIDPDCTPPWLASNLMLLGHIDIRVNNDTGEWRMVTVRQGVLRVLPACIRLGGNTEWHQAVLEGQFNWNDLAGSLALVPSGSRVDVHEQPSDSNGSPPRVRIMAQQLEDLVECANRLGVKLVKGLPDVRERRLCGRDGFSRDAWHSGVLDPAASTHFFSPLAMADVQCEDKERVGRLERLSGGLFLARQDEEYGVSHSYLCKNGDRRRLSFGELREARWLCFRETARQIARMWRFRQQGSGEMARGADLPALPYDTSAGQLAIPKALQPPHAIARILVACSGMLPRVLGEEQSSRLATFGADNLDGAFPQSFLPRKTLLLGYDFIVPEINSHAQYLLGMNATPQFAEVTR